jgi:cation diffusion facilitator family transporter
MTTPHSDDHAATPGEHEHAHDLGANQAGYDHPAVDHRQGHTEGHGHDHDGDDDHHHPTGIKRFLSGLLVPHNHDASESIDDALEASQAGVRAVKISLIGLALTAVLQLAVVIISGSVALLADTIHNFSDALTAIPLWVAFVVGRRAASKRYTYGYGRVEDLAGLFVVAMIALSAIVVGYESIHRFFEPQALTNLGWVLAAGLVGFAGNELVAVYRIRVGRRIGSAALVADGIHARTDGLTSLAVVFGVTGVWLGFPLADPIVGLLISGAIVVLLVGSARDIGRRLLDGVDPALVERAKQTLAPLPGVVSVNDVRLRWLGHRLSLEATVATDPAMPVSGFHALEHAADDAGRRDLPNVGSVRLVPSVHHTGPSAPTPHQI